MPEAMTQDAHAMREFPYSRADFERARDMIYQRAGVALSDGKRHLVYSRLSKRLRSLKLRSFDDYLGLLHANPQHPEWDEFTSALTTHLTYFFREPHHFDLLARHLAPRIDRPVRIWCAAASTGQEPYSIAMTAAEVADGYDHQVSIVASDIDQRGLATAAEAIYPLEALSKLSDARRKRFFLRGHGAHQGYAKARPELRAGVTFMPLNLQQANWPVNGPFDVIFCRNVLIYFTREDQIRLIQRLVRLLKPDGILFLGHSESGHGVDGLSPIGKTAYVLAQPTGVKRP